MKSIGTSNYSSFLKRKALYESFMKWKIYCFIVGMLSITGAVIFKRGQLLYFTVAIFVFYLFLRSNYLEKTPKKFVKIWSVELVRLTDGRYFAVSNDGVLSCMVRQADDTTKILTFMLKDIVFSESNEGCSEILCEEYTYKDLRFKRVPFSHSLQNRMKIGDRRIRLCIPKGAL